MSECNVANDMNQIPNEVQREVVDEDETNIAAGDVEITSKQIGDGVDGIPNQPPPQVGDYGAIWFDAPHASGALALKRVYIARKMDNDVFIVFYENDNYK